MATAKITKTEVTDSLRKAVGLQSGVNTIPSILNPVIIPTIDVYAGKSLDYIKTGESLNNATVTLATTPTDRDVFLTAIFMSQGRDTAATGNNGCYLAVTINGATVKLMSLASVNSAGYGYSSGQISFKYPIKLDRNTTIVLYNNVAAGINALTATVYGWTENQPA